MKSLLRTLSVLTVLISAVVVLGNEWRTFKSDKGRFTIRYPATWHRYEEGPDLLEIENFPPSKRVKGVVIPRGGATVMVHRAPPEVKTISGWLALGNEPLSKHEIGALPKEPTACKELVQAEWKDEEGPKTYSYATSFYCATGTGLYEITLVCWDDDPRKRKLQQIALTMALSFRSW